MSLASGQSGFTDALLNPALPCPSGLRTWNGSDPNQRFSVYRNNVVVSLIDALADTFPVTKALVGDAFFLGMARIYACSHPPVSRVMARYGDGFPAFIKQYPPASPLPYLADVAALEFLRVESFHAADAIALNVEGISAALSDESNLLELSFVLHPSLRCIESPFAIADC